MKNVYLTGFMCSGKSSTGRQIGRKLSKKTVDLDEQIRRKFNMDIGSIFDKYGEAFFRKAEQECLEEIMDYYPKGIIVSLGGGTIFFGDNLKKVRQNGIVVYLRAKPQTVFARAIKSSVRRPLLEVDDKLGQIESLMAKREHTYEKAAHIIIDIDGKTSYEIARTIISSIKKRGVR